VKYEWGTRKRARFTAIPIHKYTVHIYCILITHEKKVTEFKTYCATKNLNSQKQYLDNAEIMAC